MYRFKTVEICIFSVLIHEYYLIKSEKLNRLDKSFLRNTVFKQLFFLLCMMGFILAPILGRLAVSRPALPGQRRDGNYSNSDTDFGPPVRQQQLPHCSRL